MSEIVKYVIGQNVASANNDVLCECPLTALTIMNNKWKPREDIINLYDLVELKVSELSGIKFKLKEKEEKLKFYMNDQEIIFKKPDGIAKSYESIEIKKTIDGVIYDIDKYKKFIKEWDNSEKVNNAIKNYDKYCIESKRYVVDNGLNNLLFYTDIMTVSTLDTSLNKAITDLYYKHSQDNAITGLIKLNERFDLSTVKQTMRGNFLLEYKKELNKTIKFKLNMFGKNIINSKMDINEDGFNVNINNMNIKFEDKGNNEYEMNVDKIIEVD